MPLTDRRDDPSPSGGDGRPFPVSDSSRPVRSPRVSEYPLGEDEMMLFVDGRQVLHALNTTAWAVWDLCDGSRAVTDVARELSATTGHPYEAVLTDVRATVERLGALSLLNLVP